ncbi:hypothetical protein [Massilia psychrophila]|uniref:hypothetical protein n=1 Tax=Massilia psychrophila TaxID=1603353 RepID=UPI0015D4EA61|nr:hypothetical protein [Massilia psychrophila]
MDSFIDPARGPAVRAAANQADANCLEATERLEQAAQQHRVAQSNTRSAQQTFENWLPMRRATARRPNETSPMHRRWLPHGCLPKSATDNIGRSPRVSFSLRCSHFSSSWCRTCPAANVSLTD